MFGEHPELEIDATQEIEWLEHLIEFYDFERIESDHGVNFVEWLSSRCSFHDDPDKDIYRKAMRALRLRYGNEYYKKAWSKLAYALAERFYDYFMDVEGWFLK